MTWRVSVRHRTAYLYAGSVRWSYNEARVTPLTTDRQRVVEADVSISPATRTYRYWDYWGTLVDSFDIHEPHDELVVTGSSVVETSAPEPPGNVTWDELGERQVRDGLAELLAPTRHVPVVDELVELARSLTAEHSPAHACPAAVDWVRDRIRYEKDTTDVSTTAAQALDVGSGVCQDFAHVTLSLLRSMGVPARYVSGYIFPSAATEVGTVVSGQSHAWIETWTGHWHPFDPTHGAEVGEQHVIVARGRDYSDVPPLRGIYRGGPGKALVVSVEMTREA